LIQLGKGSVVRGSPVPILPSLLHLALVELLANRGHERGNVIRFA
jgi:hypothetical protein